MPSTPSTLSSPSSLSTPPWPSSPSSPFAPFAPFALSTPSTPREASRRSPSAATTASRKTACRPVRQSFQGRSCGAGVARRLAAARRLALALGAFVGFAAFAPWAAVSAADDPAAFDPFGFDATLLVACAEDGVTVRYARVCNVDGAGDPSSDPSSDPPSDPSSGRSNEPPSDPSGDPPSGPSGVPSIDADRVDSADWTFEPDRALRRAIVEAYASRMDTVGNPDAARNAAVLRRVDLIAVAGEALARFGLSGSNLADVMGVHASNLHDAATERVVESSPVTAAALSRQMAAVLSAAEVVRLDEPGERQRVADTLIIDAVLLGARTEACASGQAEGFDCATFRARAAEIGQALYGVDLTAFALDTLGLRPG